MKPSSPRSMSRGSRQETERYLVPAMSCSSEANPSCRGLSDGAKSAHSDRSVQRRRRIFIRLPNGAASSYGLGAHSEVVAIESHLVYSIEEPRDGNPVAARYSWQRR